MDAEDSKENFSPHESLQVIAEMIEKVQNDKLRKVAKKRVSFKISVVAATLVSVMFTGLWYFTTGVQSYFWPAWPMVIWCIALVIQYLEAYKGATFFSEDEEYKKLKETKIK